MLRFLSLLLSALVACSSPVAASGPTAEKAFADGQQAYHQKDYDRALTRLLAYLSSTTPQDERRFGVIEQIARIHLQYHRAPAKAVAFLEAVKKNTKLNKAHGNDIKEWLATAREWKKMGALKREDSADSLFKLGQQYYRKGVADADGQGDETGAASRYIAAGYLVPFVLNFDSDPRLAKALLMLGDIRRRSWKAEEWWTVDFYLKEVIRRFPRTKEARRAFTMLDEDIRMRWSGSGGDRTPDYLLTMLSRYRTLALGDEAADSDAKTPSP